MALLRKFFYKKPPEGLLEISERVFVFNYCFSTNVLEEKEYKVYIGGIVDQLIEYLPDASYMVFDFREGRNRTLIDDILSKYDMTVVDYPRHYEGCPLLGLETIHHFLKSGESWLSLGSHNVLLMHCERGGWPVLAFMLSALLLYIKQYNGEQRTLETVYKQAPHELLQSMSPLNPIPSQIRYLQYVSRRNVGSQWPPLDRPLTLECIILRFIPDFDGEGGCCPIFRIYGQDPVMVSDQTPKVLFSSPKKSKLVRHYKQVERQLVKIDIHCHIQGDVVLECINLDDDQEHEEMMFRVMFNTTFIRSYLLILNCDDIDMLWKYMDQFPQEFQAEVIFSEMDDAAATPVINELHGAEEKEGLPMEAFAKVQELFNNVDWLDTDTDVALDVLQHIATSNILPENLKIGSSMSVETGTALLKLFPENIKEKSGLKTSKSFDGSLTPMAELKQSLPFLKLPTDVNSARKKIDPQELLVALQQPSQSKIISPGMSETSSLSPNSYCNSSQGSPVHISRYHSAPSVLGSTALFHNHSTSNNEKESPHSPITPLSSTSSLPNSFPSMTSHKIRTTEESVSRNINMSIPLSPPPLRSLPSMGPLVDDLTIFEKNCVTSPQPSLKTTDSSFSQGSISSSLVPLDINDSLSIPVSQPSCPIISEASVSPTVDNSISMSPLTESCSSGLTPSSIEKDLLSTPYPLQSISYSTSSVVNDSLSTASSSGLSSYIVPNESFSSSPPMPPPFTLSRKELLSPANETFSSPPSPPPLPSSIRALSTTADNLFPTPLPPSPSPFPRPSFARLGDSSSLPPPHPPPISRIAPSSSRIESSSNHSPFPPPSSPLSKKAPSSSLKDSFLTPNPPLSSSVPSSSLGDLSLTPHPPHPLSDTTSSATCLLSSLLPEKSSTISSPPPPPPPPLQSEFASGPSTSSAPPPPPPPVVPPVPPPPALFAEESSKVGSVPHSNGNPPAIPGPPSAAPFFAKGRALSRFGTRSLAQTRKNNLKPYHWLKLTRAVKGSLWAEAQKSDENSKGPEIDISELESLFAVASPKGGKGKSRRPKAPKSEKVQLIELRRAYNCEIMLSKVKIPLPDLVSSILTLDESELDVDQVENLIKFCPTSEEMELLRGYKGDVENLGKCEQFFLELMKVPRIESKLIVFSYKMQFSSQAYDLRNNLDVVISAVSEVKKSSKLKRVMQTILSLGNALNHGTARGSAIGFRLDSLLRLTDTRARNNKMTLMHYLCKVIAEKMPELLEFPKDLANLEAASKIQLKILAEEMQAVTKGLEKVVQELTASENDDQTSDDFCKTLKDFLAYAEDEVKTLASIYSVVGSSADELALYFGEDPVRCPFEQVTSTLHNFVKMFMQAHAENCKRIELEKKKAEKNAQIEKKRDSKTEVEHSTQNPIPSGQ